MTFDVLTSRLLGGGLLIGAVTFVIDQKALAQPPAPVHENFEVASVRQVSQRRLTTPVLAGNRFRWPVVQLPLLVEYAYNVNPSTLLGWEKLQDLSYSIDATTPRIVTESEVRLMLRSLLEERFALKAHVEKRTEAIYNLVIDKKGLKLKPTSAIANPGLAIVSRPRAFTLAAHGRNATMSEFAASLTRYGAVDRTVIDRTGLTDSYDFVIEFLNPVSSSDIDPVPTLFTALQEQAGLRLEPDKAVLDIVVIDSVQPLTEN
jgi:uncharacterized protein (TIGR03435 family)